jgi:capsular exopolysaccharide synthesis family protein
MYIDKPAKRKEFTNSGSFQLVEVSPAAIRETPELPSSDFALKTHWQVIRRRKWMVFLFVAVVLILVGSASLLMTPQYEATGGISVGRENNDLLGLKEGSVDYSGDNTEYNMYLEAQVHILRNSAVILQAANELGWADVPGISQPGSKTESESEPTIVGPIQQHLDVSRVPRTPIIEIRYTSPDPKRAAAFVNAMIRAYVDHNFKTKYESAMQVSRWLTDELQELKDKVESSQEKEVEYTKEMGILGIDEKQNIITTKLDELNRELTAAESDRLEKQAIYVNATANNADLLPGAAENLLIQHLKQQQAEIQSQYAQATTELGSAHPKVVELKNEISQINAGLSTEINKIAERSRIAYQIALKREQMLKAALEAQKAEANRLNESAIQYNILKHDVQSNQQLYEGLLQKLKEAGVSAGLRSTNVQVVDYARVPTKPSKPNFRLNLALGLLLGCLGGGAIAFLLEKFDERLRTPDDVQVTSALPPIAMIPNISENNTRDHRFRLRARSSNGHCDHLELIAYSRPKSVIAESYRALRTSLLLSCSTAPKVILITSPLPSEGKTTIAVNCAFVLAQKGARVLLIDADLRRPRVHQVFSMSSSLGLSTLLSGSADVSPNDVIVQSAQVPGLFVLPAGPIPDQPAELLGSLQMKELLTQLRDQFDHIVIDSAPVLSATDSVILSVQVDTVVLAIRSGQTPKDALVRTRDLLLGVGARLTGVVVNAINLGELGLNNYSYYGYALQK